MSLKKVRPSDIVSDIKDKDRSEAHRALLESRSLDTGWNFALEELGRMNIKFDPAWMSGKNISCTVSSFSNNWLMLTVCICVQNTIRSTLIHSNWKGKNLQRTFLFRSCGFWEALRRHLWYLSLLATVCPIFLTNARIVQDVHHANCACWVCLHPGCIWTPMGCYLRHRIPNNFVFSCWWRLKY